MEDLDVSDRQVHEIAGLLQLKNLFFFFSHLFPDLKDAPWGRRRNNILRAKKLEQVCTSFMVYWGADAYQDRVGGAGRRARRYAATCTSGLATKARKPECNAEHRLGPAQLPRGRGPGPEPICSTTSQGIRGMVGVRAADCHGTVTHQAHPNDEDPTAMGWPVH